MMSIEGDGGGGGGDRTDSMGLNEKKKKCNKYIFFLVFLFLLYFLFSCFVFSRNVGIRSLNKDCVRNGEKGVGGGKGLVHGARMATSTGCVTRLSLQTL